MDQKKTLWIVTASGVFLVVVIFAALILNKPAPTKIPATASISPIEKSSNKISLEDKNLPTENLLNSENNNQVNISSAEINNLQNVDENKNLDLEVVSNSLDEKNNLNESNSLNENDFQKNKENPVVVIDLNQVNNVTIQNEKNPSRPPLPGSIRPKNEATANAIKNKQQSQTSSTIYTASAFEKSREEKIAEQKASSLNDAKKNNGNAKNIFAPNKKDVSKINAPVKIAQLEETKYWVQCASYSSKKTAEAARSALDQNKIPVEVFTYKDNKDNLYYRVRVGPYMTKSEAEYWQSRVASIDMFKKASSYITQN